MLVRWPLSLTWKLSRIGRYFVQITCQVCGQVSEREEEFLDLPIALSGHSGLEDALKESFIKLESLEKQNQYYCSSCKELVDAKRVGGVNFCLVFFQVMFVGLSHQKASSNTDICTLEIFV